MMASSGEDVAAGGTPRFTAGCCSAATAAAASATGASSSCTTSTTVATATPSVVAAAPVLAPPAEFPFPFEPYGIQRDFMRKLFTTLEGGGLGIFESPTGTGKSLSLICGSMAWLRAHAERQAALPPTPPAPVPHNPSNSSSSSSAPLDGPSWFVNFAAKKEERLRDEHQARLQKYKEKLHNLRAQNYELVQPLAAAGRAHGNRKRSVGEKHVGARKRPVAAGGGAESVPSAADGDASESPRDACTDDRGDDEFLPANYHSDGEEPRNMSDDEGADSDADAPKEPEDELKITKIFFCSRTHSQLSQFVQELANSPFGGDVRVVSLASRQNLCINDEVRKLSLLQRINDKCMDLQKEKADSSSKKGCKFLNGSKFADFRDNALAVARDIEDLGNLGRHLEACPYYGVRRSIPLAEIVVMPYNLLLHKSTRESVGIELKDNIVIIDEAHNLLDTIGSIHSIELSCATAMRAHAQLTQYFERYKMRFAGKNLLYIKNLLYVLNALVEHMQAGDPGSHMSTINDFILQLRIDNINLFKIQAYLDKSELSKKLLGFVEKHSPPPVETSGSGRGQSTGVGGAADGVAAGVAAPGGEYVSRHVSALRSVEALLAVLTNTNEDGRIITTRASSPSKASLKFLLLNPAVYFQEVLAEARSVIVAGGTMSPVSDFVQQLLHTQAAPPKISLFSCGHVIPKENLLTMSLTQGPTNVPFKFTYGTRGDASVIAELGRLLLNLCNVVSGGMVVFLPSYEYERQIFEAWEATGVIGRLETRKRVFREPRKASGVDGVLREYSESIEAAKSGAVGKGRNGALLLSVVGGKMSEGINFKDDLGRCIVMVGLPFPNMHSVELKAKMNYLRQKSTTLESKAMATADGEEIRLVTEGVDPGKEHYENLCMKAVNQSIGRAIRHAGDYASVVLVDSRYSQERIVAKLPNWIAEDMVHCSKVGQVLAKMAPFFKRRAAAQTMQATSS